MGSEMCIRDSPWADRRTFIDMEDSVVKDMFRQWLDKPECPWYVRDQYLTENNRRIQGVGAGRKQLSSHAEHMSKETYEARLKELLLAEDYKACAALKVAFEAQKVLSKEGEDDLPQGDNDMDAMASDTEESSADDTPIQEDIRILKMLYKGNMEEVDKSEEQLRKTRLCNRRHNFYKLSLIHI